MTNTPTTTQARKNTKDVRLDLIPPDSLWQVARVYGIGAQEYGDNDWRKGAPYSRWIAAMERHIALYKAGQNTDSDSGVHHLAHAIFHCLALIHFDLLKAKAIRTCRYIDPPRDFDDRPYSEWYSMEAKTIVQEKLHEDGNGTA